MAYRKTEKVLATLEARHNSILASAIDVIARAGMEGFTTDAVAARAGVAEGLIYKYFADKTELLAAVVAHLLARDLAAMRDATGKTKRPIEALEKGISILAARMTSNYRLMSAIGGLPGYREGMRIELARLIRTTSAVESPAILSAVVYGAIFEAARSLRPKDEQTLTGCLLRAVGMGAKQRGMVV